MKTKIRSSIFSLYFVIMTLSFIYLGGIGVAAKENALSPYDYLTIKSVGVALDEGITVETGVPAKINKSAAAEERHKQESMNAAAVASLLVLFIVPIITLTTRLS